MTFSHSAGSFVRCAAWAGVVALHLAFFVRCQADEAGRRPPPAPVELRFGGVDRIFMSTGSSGLSCADSYVGVGIMGDRWTEQYIVSDLAAGGPAELAGVRVGDELIDPMYFRDFPLGYKVTMTLKRDGREFKTVATIGRICYD